MRPLVRTVATVVALGALAVACAKVPYTNRLQYNMIPNSIMRGIGASTYTTMLAGESLQRKGEDAEILSRVGKRISKAADQPKYDWEFSMIKDDVVNAWCLPGGKIAFYTGILPALRNEAGMSFVMGHEVAHATANHGSERMSQQLALLGGLVGLEVYLANKSTIKPRDRAIILGALGVGATVGIMLPFSRMHESEADVIGMMYMAEAGYPPAESIKVWDRMEKVAGKSGIPAFLSTHPKNAKRQDKQREWLPRARKRFQRNQLQRDTLETVWPM
ncbi:MAG: putative Zn-dependent protease [Myxococcota bacterium]|jgi:predicted Zn-dependent protease